MRYELSDYEWTAIKPMLPNKPRGVRRVNDRRVLNGIFWVLRSGAPWRDLPETYGPAPLVTIASFVGRAGVWDQIVEALAAGHNATVQMSKPFSPTWRTEPMSSIVVLRSAMITVRLGLGRLRRVA